MYIYEGYEDFKAYFLNISSQNIIEADFAAPCKPYSPCNVMSQFNKNFLDGRLTPRQGVVDPGQVINFDMLAFQHFKLNGP